MRSDALVPGLVVCVIVSYRFSAFARRYFAERAWRKDEARAALLLARSEMATSSLIAEHFCRDDDWHPVDELDRLDAQEREDAAWLGGFADTARDLAGLRVFRAEEWVA